MNYRLFLFLLCVSSITSEYAYFMMPSMKPLHATNVILQGSVKFPSGATNLPDLSILYKGNEYKIEVDQEGSGNKGYFELYEQPTCKELYVLVTESLQSPKQNSIKCLQTSAAYDYKLFKLIRSSKVLESEPDSESVEKNKNKQTIEYWSVSECDNEKKEINLADNTLIFLMDPSVVSGLEEESWLSGDTLIKLPTIVFQQTLETNTLQDIAARVACAWIDVKFMHTKLSMSEKITNDRKLVMPTINTALHKTQQQSLGSFGYG